MEKAIILWRHSLTGADVIWKPDPNTLRSSHPIPSVTDTNYKIVGIGDFNGDGKDDLVWRHDTLGYDAIWLMNGTTLAGSVAIPAVTALI